MSDGEQPWLKLMQQPEYHTITLLWAKAFPSSSLWPVETKEVLDRDLFLLARRAYPLELYAALDLALWPPLIPTGVHFGDHTYSWADFHPGHRFVRLCEWMQSEQIEMTRIGGEDRNQRFREFQDRAAHQLGWPTADELAAIWREDNHRAISGQLAARNRQMPVRMESGRHPRHLAIETVLSARLTHPCDLAIGNLQYIEQTTKHVGLITRDEEDYLVIGEFAGHEWAIRPAVVRSLIMGARFLMLGPKFGGEDPRHYRPEVANSILECYGQLVGERADAFQGWASASLL